MRRRSAAFGLTVAGTLAGCVFPTPAVERYAPALSGRVMDGSTGGPIHGAAVEHRHDGVIRRDQTDARGAFALKPLRELHWTMPLIPHDSGGGTSDPVPSPTTLVVKSHGYEAYQTTLRLRPPGRGEAVWVEVKLAPQGASAPE